MFVCFYGRQTPNGARVECPAESRSRAINKQMRRKTKKQKREGEAGGLTGKGCEHINAHAGTHARRGRGDLFFARQRTKTRLSHTQAESG